MYSVLICTLKKKKNEKLEKVKRGPHEIIIGLENKPDIEG